jgi:L-lactate dehydrogenase (cytochrome)
VTGGFVAPADARAIARRRLPRFLFDYLDGGAFGEGTMRRNRADLEEVALRQRVLRDVSGCDTSTELFGETAALPLALAPIGLAGMNARRGEVAAARAAAAHGVPFCLSTVSACPLAEVAAASPVPPWFQLYMIRDRGFMRDLLQAARDHGCRVLVFTVDMPVPGIRYRDYRSGLAGAPGLAGGLRRLGQALRRPRWAWDVGVHGRPHKLGNVAPVLGPDSGMEDFFAWMRDNFDPAIRWSDLAWIRESWTGPMLIKGILDPDDARAAAEHGADGIIVSNHGGRQLDGAASTIAALPAVAAAVPDLPVLVDGGIRSGLDVVRMLASGARGVLIGRLWAYALAAGGQAGVERLLSLLAAEIRTTMALTGCRSLADIDATILARGHEGASGWMNRTGQTP